MPREHPQCAAELSQLGESSELDASRRLKPTCSSFAGYVTERLEPQRKIVEKAAKFHPHACSHQLLAAPTRLDYPPPTGGAYRSRDSKPREHNRRHSHTRIRQC